MYNINPDLREGPGENLCAGHFPAEPDPALPDTTPPSDGLPADYDLLRFFMDRMGFAPLAMLAKLKTILEGFLILERIVIRPLAFGTFEFYEIVLGHGGGWLIGEWLIG